MRVVQAAGYNDPRDAISQDWIAFLNEVGLNPILVPNRLADVIGFARSQPVSCLILTNGDDIHPARYGGEIKSGAVYAPERDETEFALYEWARTSNLPVLAVCRGFQLVNVAHGGRLAPVPDPAASGLKHVAAVHSLRICDTTILPETGPEAVQVNSYHNWGVLLTEMGKTLTPFATTADGLVEGVYSRQHPLLAMQWHPERPGPGNLVQKDLAVRFLREGAWWL